ncbi:STM3941 family protein [Bizionia sediminis]
MFKLLLLASVIIVFGLVCIRATNYMLIAIGILNLFLGVVGIFVAVYNLIDKTPQLILSEAGIIHQKITKKPILWRDISEVTITKRGNNHVLIVTQKGHTNRADFKYLFRKTAKSKLKNNIIPLNLDSLAIDYPKLHKFLDFKLGKQTVTNALS